jgi:hypothetical protein
MSSASERPSIRTERAASQLKAGDHAQATRVADEVASAEEVTSDALYNAACIFSLASGKVKNAQQEELYAGRAMELLRQAVLKGFHDLAHMKKDTDLDPLRKRQDFQKLIAELEAKKAGKPATQAVASGEPELVPPPQKVP